MRVAAAALFLACKLGDIPVKADAVCAQLYDLEMTQKRKMQPDLQAPPLSDRMKLRLRESLFDCEFALLECSAFEVNLELPYDYLERAQARVPKDMRETFLRVARNFVNDSYRTQLCVYKSASAIAESCIFLASEYLRLGVPAEPDQEAVEKIIDLYKAA